MKPSLSHNVAPDPTTSRPENESRTFSQLRTSLIKVLRNSPEAREPICDALELIESLQQQREEKQNPDGPRALKLSRQEPAQDYVIQSTSEGLFLTERRPSGSQPFRCPKSAYDAAAQILAAAKEPLHFDELLGRLNAATNQRHADYRLRLCLRFWMAHQLIERFRNRYRALEGEKFLEQAGAVWKDAAA